jgi:hypothetical protein
MYGSLSDAGYDATLLVYDLKIHEYSSIYDNLPQLFRFFAAHRLKRDPATITFTHPAGQDRPDLGLVYDHAYWLSDLLAADPKAPASVTITSGAIRHSADDPGAAQRTTQVVDDTGAPTKRAIGELYSTTPAAGPDLPRTNSLTIKAANAAGLTVDAVRARIRVARGLRIDSDSDRPFTLTLRGPNAVLRRIALAAGKQSLTL